jgi:hypothetical protein
MRPYEDRHTFASPKYEAVEHSYGVRTKKPRPLRGDFLLQGRDGVLRLKRYFEDREDPSVSPREKGNGASPAIPRKQLIDKDPVENLGIQEKT